ncbi:sulfate/thiosulfate import ATP-binding protein CysA [Terrihabitans soli]|uniref:Sulfate/thiosulfate import ATP-binding protein CysA n=1 Tax=Terrihabitans soli TaxID=708113 RepID=A0A6S6QS11_9HYPH|nr:TOBE-like domain-containing protein [Terrihabitans soli]BCJ91849.1 sulfate/thiosulfate import ATP-binding protein CysA [Terrihabitans soli]
MNIDVQNVTKNFGAFKALDDVSLKIRSGELIALLGPSGSGKTTLLRIIAGLEWPDGGAVRFDGEDALSLTVKERDVGFVFQHYALFRHMTVYENIAFGLRVRPRNERQPEFAIKQKVEELLHLVQIGSLAGRYPSQLSGGQRQRVALARALAIEPRVLLLDEPFGALDAKVRKDLRRWLRNLHSELHVTSILVTHDQEEALEVSDRVVVMGQGKIEQVGTPSEVYDSPATAFVHDFIGESVALPILGQGKSVSVGGKTIAIDAQGVEGKGRLFVRPHDIEISQPGPNALDGKVLAVRRFGPTHRVDLEVPVDGGKATIEAAVPAGRVPVIGEKVGLIPERYRVFAG